jgi:(2Fe-2S) ferredoxin/precorrin-6B methylase 2
MEPFKYHVVLCDQKKPDGVPGCNAKGSAKVIEALRKEVLTAGLSNDVQITTCGSLGLCERGPNIIVYPEGIWYSGVTEDDVPIIVREHFKEGKVVDRLANYDVSALRKEIESNRSKMMASLKARDEAGVLPDEIMQMVQGFRESRIILTAIELDMFSAVNNGATSSDVARKLFTDPRATEMILNALVALGLLKKTDGKYENSLISSRYFCEGSQNDLRQSLMHTVNLWTRWSTMTECIRKGTSVVYKEQVQRKPEDTKAFIAAMESGVRARAKVIVNAIGADKISRMLDVGGGSAGYSIAFARANNKLEAVVFDLPNVIPLTKQYIEDADLVERIKTRAGDMRTDDLGSGFDLVFISAICHMNSPEENKELLRKSFNALISRGRVVVQDFILDPDKTSPKTAVLFALNMLVGTRQGNTYSESEYYDWLSEAGFKDIRHISIPGPTGLIMGVRP